ncbi:AMP-binding protein [Spirosoma radiotolerans]|uniref:O-succinylbenzoic acid--CoA ligase n=1 Tax=Spirosoma radiotolerans TaxID=1379870 RepID=A0A0E3ZU41_9BACT|nr:AMP-binding protein [Spirosoma radiotolerans]AKD55380.1 O-succinylbenzoic acid--CoA ligase [Spirosoma radiotolerans]
MVVNPVYPDTWPVPQTPYEDEALAFCRAWLANQQQFTLFTSGSTGTPKSIQLTRAQMKASAYLTGQTLGLQAGDPALVCLNIRYVAGIMMLVRGLELGLPMTIIEPASNPLDGLNLAMANFAFTALVPLQLQTILANSNPESRAKQVAILSKMKAILVGGAATSLALEQALQEINAPVYATYGMTETVSHIALRRLNGPDTSDVFTALTGVELGTDARGCLHITSAATNFERIQTNDVVDLIASSNGESTQFRLLGRADRVINTGGVKVQPEQVESLIQAVLATDKAVSNRPVPRLFVAGLPDERLGQRIVVISEQEPINTDQWQRIQHAIRETLGPYAVPKERITVARFAETPTGKVDQKATVAQMR